MNENELREIERRWQAPALTATFIAGRSDILRLLTSLRECQEERRRCEEEWDAAQGYARRAEAENRRLREMVAAGARVAERFYLVDAFAKRFVDQARQAFPATGGRRYGASVPVLDHVHEHRQRWPHLHWPEGLHGHLHPQETKGEAP